MIRPATALLVAACLALPGGSAHASGEPPARAALPGEIRVNQQGYLPGEPKVALLMAPASVSGSFEVEDQLGDVVLTGTIPAGSEGAWNSGFPEIYRLDLSALTAPGTYHVVVGGAVSATSPEFEIADAETLYRELLTDGVRFDQAQRDGAQVIPGTLGRRPAHLLDRSARVYAWPHMVRGEDLITDQDLDPSGTRADVEGGWADAGDYLKFTHSSAYNDVLLFTSARLLGGRAPTPLLTEARFGARWLAKMWDRRTGTLHLQVGIGSGNRAGTFYGDHDGWRLPEADDHNTAQR